MCKKDFASFQWLMFVLALIAAALSPRPLWLIPVIIAVYFTAWIVEIIFPGQARPSPTLEILPDGRIRFLSENNIVGQGELGSHHWCTQQLAVINVIIDGDVKRYAVIASHKNAGDFRRLRLWIRHGICNNTS